MSDHFKLPSLVAVYCYKSLTRFNFISTNRCTDRFHLWVIQVLRVEEVAQNDFLWTQAYNELGKRQGNTRNIVIREYINPVSSIVDCIDSLKDIIFTICIGNIHTPGQSDINIDINNFSWIIYYKISLSQGFTDCINL